MIRHSYKRMPRLRRLLGDRGAALVEMALIVPLLGLLVFGIIIFGLLLALRQNLAQAAAEGARAGAVAPPCPTPTPCNNASTAAKAAVDDAVNSFSRSCGDGKLTCGDPLTPLTPFVVVNCPAPSTAKCIKVKLTLVTSGQVVPDIPIISSFLPGTITAESVAEVSP